MSTFEKYLNISRRSAYTEGTVKILEYSRNFTYIFVVFWTFIFVCRHKIFFVYMLSVYVELSNSHSLLEII